MQRCICPVYNVPDAAPPLPGSCPVHAPAVPPVKTIGRSSSQGSSSGRFFAPLDVTKTPEGKVAIHVQRSRANPIEIWPDEAEELAMALIKLANWTPSYRV